MAWSAILVAVSCGLPQLAGAEEPEPLSPREIVERAGDAVVLIEARLRDQTAQGSGFLADDGVVVTNLHVIDGATSVTVSLRNGTRVEEIVVRSFDVARDLAVIGIELPGDSEAPVPLDLGDTSAIRQGSRILVIGNPLGLEHTVTEGIVSAWREAGEPGSRQQIDAEQPALPLPATRLLQISATISPGSSGGPVLNERAEVVGVATSGVLWGMAGLNFAVPVDALAELLAEDDSLDLETFGERVADVRRELAEPVFDEARFAHERGDVEEAAGLLERALQLFPRHEEALLLSGRIAMTAGKLDLAEERFTLATEIDEYNADAWYHLGSVHQLKAFSGGEATELPRAETAFERALEIDERHGQAAFRLALIQIRKGDLDRAEGLLLSAVENESGLADAHYTLGEVYMRRGRSAEAKAAFEQALWENGDHARSHFGLARLYMDLERTPQGTVAPHGRAEHHWEEFLRLSEDDPAVAQEREVAVFIIKQYYPHLLD